MTKEEKIKKVLSIDPNKMYYADYWIDKEGIAHNESVVLLGKDLTERQIETCEPINI